MDEGDLEALEEILVECKQLFQDGLIGSEAIPPNVASVASELARAFPATFEAAADVSGARQAHPSPQLDQALASLWLRSVLCAGLLTAAVRALQSRAHLRAAYTSDALALAPEALATGRAVEAELAALQGAAAALRPNARELESLGELRNAAAQGRWDAAAAEAVVEEEFSWQGVLDGGAAPKEERGDAAAPMPNQAASVWLRRVSSHAGAFAQTAQQSIGGLFSSRKGASGVSGAEVATGAESAVKRQAADGWRAEGVRDPGVRQRGRYSRHDCEMFQEQAELLLQEATAATTQLYAALRSGNHHATPPPPRASAAAHAPMDQARLLMHLLGSCVEFGVKEDWRHVLGGRPTARESSFVAARAVQLAAPSPAAMLQAREYGWRAPPCTGVPVTATLALCPGAPHAAALRAFLHAAFNERRLGRVLAALTPKNSPLLRDWYYVWAPLRQPEAAALTAALAKLDSAPAGQVVLPVESVLGDAPPPALTQLQARL